MLRHPFCDNVKHVLEQIALCASIDDYKRFVEEFYTPADLNSGASFEESTFRPPAKGYGRIQQLAWVWLTQNPEIWVGQNKEGNALSLHQLEVREAKLSARLLQSSKEQPPESQQPVAGKQKPAKGLTSSRSLRIWTTRDRVWQTLTGHGVDFKRIPPMEFSALSVIAAAGPKGILQPEVIHITGQDKRSLPKRTDNLAKNGYIDKKAVMLKSQKTSLLRLARFASMETSEVFSNGRLVLDNFLRRFCEWVKEGDAIPLSELEERLGCAAPGWQKTMLWRALERLDIIGVIERFYRLTHLPAKSDPNKSTAALRKPKFIRLKSVPTEEHKHRYWNITGKDRDAFRQRLELQDAEAKMEHAEYGKDDEDYSLAEAPEVTLNSLPEPDSTEQIEHTRAALRWNPDLPYTNNIMNVLGEGDSGGMSTMDLRGSSYGHFYARAVDQILGRLTDDWEKSQPSDLRHLNVIRDTGTTGKFSHYLYRTYPQFQEAVKEGQTSWETVSHKRTTRPVDQPLDEWGFPRMPPSSLLNNGRATLSECVASARIPPEPISASDPVVVKYADGTIGAQWGAKAAAIMSRLKKMPDGRQDPIVGQAPAPAVKRAKGAKGQSVVMDFLPEKPGQPITKDQSAYNAAYRRMQRLQRQAQERALQIRRQAERVAYEEVLQGTGPTIKSQSASGRKYIKNSFCPPKTGPHLVIVNDINNDQDVVESDDAGNPSNPASDLEVPLVGPDSAKKARQVREKLFVSESRVQDLVLQFSDVSRNAVHINPPGSLFDEKIGPGRPFKTQHMVVFKFPWLKDFDWFMPEAPANVEPPSVVEPPSLVEPTSVAGSPPFSGPSPIAEVPHVTEAPRSVRHQQTQATTELLTSSENTNHTPDTPVARYEGPSVETNASPDDRSHARKSLQSKAKVTKAAATKQGPGKKVLPAPGVYVQKTRGRRPLDGPRKLVLIFRSDRLQDLCLAGNEENSTLLTASANQQAEPDESRQHTPQIPSRRSSHADAQSRSTSPFPSEKGYAAESPASSHYSDGYIHPSPEPAARAGPGRRKQGTVLGRGAVALKREMLVMQIIDKCGGMFPGDSEIVGPYQRIQKQNQNTQSDRNTITRAVESLVQSGKLKRIGFEFPSNDGAIIRKHLVIKAEISNDAPEVQNMIAEIRKIYPTNFIPEVLEPPIHSVPHRTQLNRYYAEGRQDRGNTAGSNGPALGPASRKKRGQTGEQVVPSSSDVGPSLRERTSSIVIESDYPAGSGHGKKISGTSNGPKTLGELLTDMGSYVTGNDADSMYDPMDEDAMVPSIEQDIAPVTRGRLRSRKRLQVPVEQDSWISENPKDPVNTLGPPSEGSSSVYSASASESEADQDPILESESEENAGGPVKSPLISRKRRRLNDEESGLKDIAPSRTGKHKKAVSQAVAASNSLTFKEPIGPEAYDPTYQWQRLRSLLDPDQHFYAKSGTFSTDFFVLRNVQESAWMGPPRGPIEFEHWSSTNETDIRNLLTIDDFDSHYHPDKLQNKHTLKKLRFYYEDSDDNSGDEIERAWFERQELEIMRGQYPGLSLGKKTDGFVNYTLSHALEVSKEPVDPMSRKYKARTIVYGAQERDIASLRNEQQLRARGPITRAPPKSRNAVASGQYTGNKVTAKQSGKCFISAEVAKRLLFVTIAIRALAGGVDQTIRWPCVIEVFKNHPNFDPPTFKARWLRMLNNHRILVDQLEQEFREKYLAAYARGEVQATDARNFQDYDWSAIGDWAMENIPVYPEDITLPYTRDLVDTSYDIMVTPRDTQEQRERMDHPMATNMARAQYTGDLLFALPLRAKKSKKTPAVTRTPYEIELQIAKSWARACSATSDSDFDPQEAEAKLKALPDATLKEALEQLHADKLISHQFKGRIRNGRAFRLADSYNSALFTKRQLEPQHFLEAVAFKKYLDDRFTGGEDTILLHSGFKDGDIMVLTELSASGRLTLRPVLPPVNSTIGDPWPRLSVWGFSEGHYRLRNLDKSTFSWDVEISKTATYVYGLPMQQKLSSMPPPSGPTLANSGKKLIPMWYDIHGNVVQFFWSNMVRCVVQAAAFHAGCSMENLTAAFKGFIWDWEVRLVVQWLIDLGVAKWIGGQGQDDGLMVCEWWWSIVPDASEKEKIAKPSAVETTRPKSSRSTAARSMKKKGKTNADD
ncbi:hypothetical protein FKW77_003681 [Venturia effusa]|uniref:Uncharacterized protein n=1 Tax=Venturia effusa TaxID=50376 RepID=A0A517LNP4_9PEZI|nr:hypothetical protein FKW77_003681 [Venturia effusa]